MNEIVLYYSLSGHTKAFAEALASERGAALAEICEQRRRFMLTAFVPGIIQAIRRTRVKLRPIDARLADYDKITLAAPVWADSPAPALNAVIDMLPSGKTVELFLISASGRSSHAAVAAEIEARGCTVSVTDRKNDE